MLQSLYLYGCWLYTLMDQKSIQSFLAYERFPIIISIKVHKRFMYHNKQFYTLLLHYMGGRRVNTSTYPN